MKENWTADLDLEGGWRTLFLFHMFEKIKGVNFCLMNFLLSPARLAVVHRGNYAHFEGWKVKIKEQSLCFWLHSAGRPPVL